MPRAEGGETLHSVQGDMELVKVTWHSIGKMSKQRDEGFMVSRAGRGEFYYGWVIVAITALILIGAAGIRSAAGVMILPMAR